MARYSYRSAKGGLVSIDVNGEEFHTYVRQFIKETEYDTASSVLYTARELGMRIVARNPVKTYRSVAGWSKAGERLGFDVPQSSESKGGDSGYSQRLTGPDPYVRMENRVPYTIYLEYGWSKQAPLGMVRISIAELKSNGILPRMLAKSYQDRWEGKGAKRYEMQSKIMSRGLPAVKTIIPTRRSIAARLSHQYRQAKAKHGRTAVISRIRKGFSGS